MHFVSEHFALCIYKIKMINSLKDPHSFPTRRSSDLQGGMPRDDAGQGALSGGHGAKRAVWPRGGCAAAGKARCAARSEEHTSELQSRGHLVCRLLLEKKKTSDKRPSGGETAGRTA